MRDLVVVVFSYYFPPNNDVGVRRISYWINYLLENGYKVELFTVDRGDIPNQYCHENLEIRYLSLKGIYRNSVRLVPFSSTDSKISALLKLIKTRIINPWFGQLFDPRVLYVIPMKIWLKRQPRVKDRVVLATSPPFFVLVLAKQYSRLMGTPLIIDYRDQFSDNPMFAGKFVFLERYLDKMLATSATIVTTVSDEIKEYYQLLGSKRLEVIRNGFDERFFYPHLNELKPVSENIIMTYVGSIVHESRIPKAFLRWLEICEESVTLNFYGDVSLLAKYVKRWHPTLESVIKYHGGVDFIQVPEILSASHYVLVFEETYPSSSSQYGTVPTKVYEYLAVGRPIIVEMSEELRAFKVLEESGLLVHNFNNNQNIDLTAVRKLNKKFEINKYSRNYGAVQLERIIQEIIK